MSKKYIPQYPCVNKHACAGTHASNINNAHQFCHYPAFAHHFLICVFLVNTQSTHRCAQRTHTQSQLISSDADLLLDQVTFVRIFGTSGVRSAPQLDGPIYIPSAADTHQNNLLKLYALLLLSPVQSVNVDNRFKRTLIGVLLSLRT